ncbi:MAG: GxxExxY protein [Methylacidiphilales bacterium]|nr:GxxExxY protein [Candidatus Methylacidiphilales bacterium]
MKTENEIAKEVVNVCYKIHTTLGPGLLESVYEDILAYELEKRSLQFKRQQPIALQYEKIFIKEAFRADLIVEDKVILELKSVEQILPVHSKQLLAYLKLTRLKLGLLVNFGAPLIKDGMTRLVNKL